MDGHDGGHWLARLIVHQDAKPVVESTAVFHVLKDFRRVHVVSAFIDVHKPEFRARLRYGLRGRYKRMRHGDYDIARLYSSNHQREPQRIGSAAYPTQNCCRRTPRTRVRNCSTIVRDESSRMEGMLENLSKLLFKRDVMANEV